MFINLYKSKPIHFLTLSATTCRVGDEGPSLKTEDVIMCCVAVVVVQLRAGDRCVWSNGGMIISREKSEKLLQCHVVHPEPHMKSLET
jgi:hypothetical protein